MRPMVPNGLLDLYRDVSWVRPMPAAQILDEVVEWLDTHPVEALPLFPGLAAAIKDEDASPVNQPGPIGPGWEYRCICVWRSHPNPPQDDDMSGGCRDLFWQHLISHDCRVHAR